MSLKIAVLNTYDCVGGAARAAYRLCQALDSVGLEVRMFVQKKFSSADFVHEVYKTRSSRASHYLKSYLQRRLLSKSLLSLDSEFSLSLVASTEILQELQLFRPDIIHLHWICDGFLTIPLLQKLNQLAPIVWSLHDMWAFTGGCHYSSGCRQFEKDCSNCSKMKDSLGKFLVSRAFKQRNIYKSLDMTFIGLSNWIYQEAQKSFVCQKAVHCKIPNLINPKIFKPISQVYAREILNLPKDKKLILFGAASVLDSRKGLRDLLRAIKAFSSAEVGLIVLGRLSSEVRASLKDFDVFSLGELKDESSIVLALASSDVVAVPSHEENLSNMIYESLLCGKPVVAFNIGGNSDLIEHRKTGYLVSFKDSEDFQRGLFWALENSSKNPEEITRLFQENFNFQDILNSYIELYSRVKRA